MHCVADRLGGASLENAWNTCHSCSDEHFRLDTAFPKYFCIAIAMPLGVQPFENVTVQSTRDTHFKRDPWENVNLESKLNQKHQ